MYSRNGFTCRWPSLPRCLYEDGRLVLTPLTPVFSLLSYDMQIEVDSPNVTYSEEEILSKYYYEKNFVEVSGGKVKVTPGAHKYTFKTMRKVSYKYLVWFEFCLVSSKRIFCLTEFFG